MLHMNDSERSKMSSTSSKSIFVSYASSDREIAGRLRAILTEYLGNQVWLRDFDLNAGDLLVKTIDFAIADANWFVLLLSKDALRSPWVEKEASQASLRAIEDLNFKILVIKLDESPLPVHLEAALHGRYVVDLTGVSDIEKEFIQIAASIEETTATGQSRDVYVDRGNAADQFSLLTRRNRVIFLLGWAGIGKTAFVTHSAVERLHKRPFVIRLTRGHSADLLARQILEKTHVRQPVSSERMSDSELTNLAIDALRQRSDGYFLLLDNAEQTFDISNQLLEYLDSFLSKFIEGQIDTHIILATARLPDFSANIAGSADLYRLEKLEDRYIQEMIDMLLEGTSVQSQVMSSPELQQLISLAGGHPLAAKMIAAYLKVRTPRQLLVPEARNRLQLKLAEYVLQSTDQLILTALHRLLLHILATAQTPMSLEDLLSVNAVQQYSLPRIHKSVWELADWFMIEQNGEFVSLHPFLNTFFQAQLSTDPASREKIISDFGKYAFQKAMDLNEKLTQSLNDGVTRDSPRVAQISNDIFRYAVPAARLLRMMGQDKMAEDLPIQVKGTLREMVFYFYQEARDYRKACTYAERWLELNPDDREIMLYLARAYRNLREPQFLALAEDIIAKLEKKDYKRRFVTRILREKALISENRGDIARAKELFGEGIRVAEEMGGENYLYIENHVGLAQLLLREIDQLPEFAEKDRFQKAEQALGLLDIASAQSVVFDRYHSGLYVEALIQANKVDIALPMLANLLQDRPDDERLNYKMAEVLRKRSELESAEVYAWKALKHGAPEAPLSLSNIMVAQAQKISSDFSTLEARQKLTEGLRILSGIHHKSIHDQEVADGLASKIHRFLGEWNQARALIFQYPESDNVYTLYEQFRIEMHDAELAEQDTRYAMALQIVQSMLDRLNRIEPIMSIQLMAIQNEAKAKQASLKHILA